uniref:hypothetical protein n=1 Tax=Pedobacter schmidteae TaxID=2201271 RepID=UPI000EB0871A|nr:hypothetical protein [Pedobacter schmidteae]
MKRYIVDNEGNLLEVTDLKAAIFQVAAYLRYEIENPTKEEAEFHRKRLIYWKDIYSKLVILKQDADKTTAIN